MALWLLEPVADPDDSWWQGRPQFARVVVRAESPAFARVVAEPLDTPDKPLEAGQESAHLGSGFKDEKLYQVVPYHTPEHGDAYPEDGSPEVLDSRRR